jgi:streptogramin lyase
MKRSLVARRPTRFQAVMAGMTGAATLMLFVPPVVAHASGGSAAPPSCTSTATCTHVQEWQMPIPIGAPKSIVSGPDGAMWAFAAGADEIVRIDSTDGALLSAWPVPDVFHATYSALAAGPDGNMWFTDPAGTTNANATAANSIVKIDMTGQMTHYPLSPNGATPVGPRGIVPGPTTDANSMWFADSANGDLIGRINTDGTGAQSWSLPGYTGTGFAITRGPDANGTPNAAVWLATYSDTSSVDHLLRLEPNSTAGGAPQVTLAVALPSLWHATGLTGGPVDPVTGKQDGVWLTDDTHDRLGHVTPTGSMTSWPVTLQDPDAPSGGSQGCQAPNAATGCAPGSLRSPTAITVGPDNLIWVDVKSVNSIARFDPQTQTFDRQYRGLSTIVRPVGIASGPDGNVWYTSVDGSLYGRVVLSPVADPVPQASSFTVSGPFDYYLNGLQFPLHQVGQPFGLAPSGSGRLEVAMAQSDRLQRVPTSLAGGPLDADHEQIEANETTDPTTAALPWRTINIPKAGPRLILGNGPGTSNSEWVTMYDDTVERVIPGNASLGDTWLSVATVTGLAACCLTVPGVIGLSGPGDVANAQNGNIWFTEFASGNVALASGGVGVELTPPTVDSGPFGLTGTSDGSMWFAESKAGQIGRMSNSAGFTEYPLGAGTDPYGVTTGPDGNVWFTLRGTNEVGRIDPAGHVSRWAVPTAGSQPTAIKTGPDGAMYVTEYLAGKVARLTVDASGTPSWTEWSLPYGARSFPYWITAGPDGHMWVTLPYRNRIARLDP